VLYIHTYIYHKPLIRFHKQAENRFTKLQRMLLGILLWSAPFHLNLHNFFTQFIHHYILLNTVFLPLHSHYIQIHIFCYNRRWNFLT
jgi:hypothetical protein